MVAGDLVNTASRIQSARRAGHGAGRRGDERACGGAIVYEDAGRARAQGQGRAGRSSGGRCGWSAGVGGALGSTGLEAPFVGRDRELRLVKELFHARPRTAERSWSRSIGIGGIGKSRLALGVREVHRRARGRRLLAPGPLPLLRRGRRVLGAGRDGSRARAGSPRTRSRAAPRAKLRAARRGARPGSRGAPLRRAAARPPARARGAARAGDQENLFAAWRAVLRAPRRDATRRCSSSRTSSGPTRACSTSSSTSLDWSRDMPIFVLTLARPELDGAPARPGAPGKRNFTSLYLEPLSPRRDGGAAHRPRPGLPDELRDAHPRPRRGRPACTRSRPCACCSTAVLLVREDGAYRLTGEIETLEVPETLHALLAARLDGLAPEERGSSRTRPCSARRSRCDGLGALSGSEDELEPLLAALVRKEVLVAPGRPALARARAVRVPPGPRRGRLRDALAAGAQGSTSRRRASLRRSATRRRSSRSSPRTTSTRTGRPPTTPTPRDPRDGTRRCSCAPASAPRRSPRNEEAQHALRACDRARRRSVRAGRAARARRPDGRRARGPRQRARTSRRRSRCFDEAGETHAGCPGRGAPRARSMWDRGARSRGSRADGPRLSGVCRRRSRTRTSPARRQLGRFLFFAGRPRRRDASGSSSRSSSPRLALPETFSQALNTKAILLVSPRHGCSRASRSSGTRSRSRSSTTNRRRR